MSFLASTVHPSRRAGAARRYEVFAVAEQKLAGREWAVGDYSIADIHLFRLFWRWMDAGGPTPGSFPAVSAHYDRMMQRPAVRRVLEIESTVGYEMP